MNPSATGTGAEVISVAPVSGGDRTRMHGFEFSIARMLDGRRTAQDVLVNCKRLGLPVSLDALEDFLHQLEVHGLIGAGAPPQRTRTSWSDTARELYRASLKAAREGHIELARRHVDALLTLQPGIIEAARLREWLEHPPRTAQSFHEVFEHTLQAWADERPAHWAAEARDAVRKSAWPIVAPIAAAGFLIGFALLPRPQHVKTTATLATLVGVPVPAPSAGVVDQVLVAEGERVEAGTPLFTYGVTELRSRVDELEKQLEVLRAPLREQIIEPAEAGPLREAYQRARADVAAAQGAFAQQKTPKTQAGLQEAEQRLGAVLRELDARIPPDGYRAKLAANVEQELRQLEDRIAVQTVTSPAAGLIASVNVEPGQAVEEGEPTIQIDGLARLKLTAQVKPRQARGVHIGSPITIWLGQDRVFTKVEEVKADQITAEVPNLNGALSPGSTKVELDLPPTSIVRR